MKKIAIISALILGALNAAALDIYCEVGMSPREVKKFKLSRGEQVIEQNNETVTKALINDYNLRTVRVQHLAIKKNILQAETIVADNSAAYVGLNYLKSVDDDVHQMGGTICGATKEKVLELRKFLNQQSDKLGSEVK